MRIPRQVWSKYRGLHGDAPGIQRNQWAAAEVRKVDGDFASYTVSEGRRLRDATFASHWAPPLTRPRTPLRCST